MMAKTSVDPTEILKQLDEQEAKAFAEFQEAQKARREKALSGVLQPLKERRARAAQERNELDMELNDLDKQIARLVGREARQHKPQKQRRNKEDKYQVATLLYGSMRQHSGKRYSSGELEGATDGIAVRELVKIWNEANPDKEIGIEGAKASTRYFVGR